MVMHELRNPLVAAGADTVLAEVSGDSVFTEQCPSRTLLTHVTNKWGTLVILALAAGTLRWSELSRAVGGISEKMLAQTLRTLEADGVVRRDARPVVPPFVEYSLTDSGAELSRLLIPLVQWVAAHASENQQPAGN
jgi:DNA-binding HxlR family transcriptional regulator